MSVNSLTKESVENLMAEFPLSEQECKELNQRIEKRHTKYKTEAQKQKLTPETLASTLG
jgi:hypothetical protein